MLKLLNLTYTYYMQIKLLQRKERGGITPTNESSNICSILHTVPKGCILFDSKLLLLRLHTWI